MTTRTSEDSPIQVAFLPQEQPRGTLPGRLGLTFAPGKKVRGIVTHWERDLETDLRRLVETYGATRLVTLLEDHELPLLHIPDLFEKAQVAGLKTRHFPIPDGGVPGDERAYRKLLNEIVQGLADGETIIVHCRGGLGRTGLVAAGVLMSLGVSAPEAMRQVRLVRPMAIETQEQERFLLNGMA